jgi:hypothetical protein
MKQKYLPYLILFILFNTNFTLFSQIGQEQNFFQEGRNLYSKGLYLTAKTAFKQAIIQAKKDNFYNEDQLAEIEYFIVLSDFHLDPKNIAQSIERYIRKYKNNPFALKLTNEIGSLYFKSGNYKIASEYLSAKLNRTEAQSYQLGYSYFMLRDYPNAQIQFELLAKSQVPEISKPSLYYLGYIYFLEKKYENAITALAEIDKKPQVIGLTAISQEENIQINKTYSSLWLQSLFYLNSQKPYKSIFDLVERKNITQDKSQNIFTKDIQRFVADLYFAEDKFDESVKIYTNLSIDPKSDSLIKYREAYAKLKKAGKEKSALKSLISDLEKLSTVRSDSLKQHVFVLLGDANANLDENKLAEVAFDRSIEINFDTAVSQQAALRKIQIYTEAKNFPAAYAQVNKYLLKYSKNASNDTFNNLFIRLLTFENNVSNSIENINKLSETTELPKSLFEEYTSELFFNEVSKESRDYAKIKELFAAATKYKIDKGGQIDLNLGYLNGLLQDAQKLNDEFDAITGSIKKMENKTKDDPKSFNLLSKNPDYKAFKERRIKITNEKKSILDQGIQLTSKYFGEELEALIKFRSEKFSLIANNTIYCYLNSNNEDYGSQENLVNKIFETDLADDSTRKNAIRLYKDMISFDSKYWANFQKLTSLAKLSTSEKDFYTYLGVVIKKETINKQKRIELDDFYAMVDNYMRHYATYKNQVIKLRDDVLQDDDSPDFYPIRLEKINLAIKNSELNSTDYFLNLLKRVELNTNFGKKQNPKYGDTTKIAGKKDFKINYLNFKYKEIKQDLIYIIDNSSDVEEISNTTNDLYELSHENNDEMAFMERFPKNYPDIQRFWNDCIKIKNANSASNALNAYKLFASTYPEKNIKYNVTYELAKIYLEQKDSLQAELKFKELLTDWKFYAADSGKLKYVTGLLPGLSIPAGNFITLEKLYAAIPTEYLPKEFINSGHLRYLIWQSVNLKAVEAEKYYTELMSNSTNYEELSPVDKKYYLDKNQKLLKIYSNEVKNQLTEKNIKTTLKKIITAKEDQKIQNQLKDNYWQLANIVVKDDTLSDFWNAISAIKTQLNSSRDSIQFARKLIEYRDIRCQKNDSINVNSINQELIEVGKRIPGISKTKIEQDAGANAILDIAKNLWHSNNFLELNQFLYNYIFGENTNSLNKSQKEYIYPEAFLFIGLSFEKLNKCQDAKELYGQAYALPIVIKDKNIHSIILDRFNQLKCAQ